ncbi:MAG: phosphatase PAP2 family protein [Caldilineales bacterium]|nr:phosphatase PAP2 family protein [Caldilineales bacterium]
MRRTGTITFAWLQLQRWTDTVAHVVSVVLSPPVLAATMLVMAAGIVQEDVAWLWAGIGLIMNIVAPMGYVVRLFRRGVISDFDIGRREERRRPLVFTLASMLGGVTLLTAGAAPRLVLAVVLAQMAQTILILLITLHWKISVHSAAMAAMLAFLLYLTGAQAISALPALPLVAWSRVRLRRHTPAQTVGGAILGGLITWGILYLFLKPAIG